MFGIYNVLSTFAEDILIKYGVFNVYYQCAIMVLCSAWALSFLKVVTNRKTFIYKSS